MAQVTVLEALTLLGANEQPTIQYFEDLGLLDPFPLPSAVWASERMRRKLNQHYKKRIFSLHPDKLGNGDSIELHRVKGAWAKLKKYHVTPIDLTNMSDSDDSDDEEEHETEGRRTERDHSLNPCNVLVACVVPNPSASYEMGKADSAENSQKEEAQSVDDTNVAHYERYIGKEVRKDFWFQGRVTSLDIGETEDGKEVVLVHVEFDDEDKEDYELHEWESELEIDDKPTLSDGKYHPLGAVVWKKFVLEGTVTDYRIGEKNVIFLIFCNDE